MLVFGETTLTHDNILWVYPIFQFLAENLINGNFPFWNPFTHGGEPFYSVLAQLRFLEPSTLLTIIIGSWFTHDLVMLFNWNRLIQTLIMAGGVYLVLRPLSGYLIVRLSLIPILLFSSFFLGSFRQDAILNQFMWAPYMTFFLLRILHYRDYAWHNWLLLGALIGINWQSYFFTGTWLFLMIFAVGMVLFRRDMLRDLFVTSGCAAKMGVLAVIVLAMAIPNVTLMAEEEKYVFPSRMVDAKFLMTAQDEGITPRGTPLQMEGNPQNEVSSILMPYPLISYTGTFSSIWNFLQIIAPGGNRYVGWQNWKHWGDPSEAYIYIGLLPWSIALLGMVAGRHDLKRVWLILLLGFGLFLLGPAGGIHKILYYVYPPVWFVRHTHAFVLFFVFALLYFYVLGLNHIIMSRKVPLSYPKKAQMGEDGRRFRQVQVLTTIACIILLTLLGFRMSRLNHPETDLVYFLVLIFLAGLLLRRRLGDQGLLTTLIASHFILVFIFSEERPSFLTHASLAFFIPTCLYAFTRCGALLSISVASFLKPIVPFIFVVCLLGDLGYTLHKSRWLYESQPHPSLLFQVKTTPVPPHPPGERESAPKEKIIGDSKQSIRYVSLLQRKPFAFSPVNEDDTGDSAAEAEMTADFGKALRGARWTSFFMLRTYFKLIHSGLPPTALMEIFALKKDPFQFKRGAIISDNLQFSDGAAHSGSALDSRVLGEYAIVDKEAGRRLAAMGIPAGNIREFLSDSARTTGNDPDFRFAVSNYRYDSLDLEVNTAQAGLLYWADGFDPWWKVFKSDGTEIPIFRANENFKALPLEKGKNSLRLVYKPRWFAMGIMIFYAAALFAVLGSVAVLWLQSRIGSHGKVVRL
jgi:hypothetical protein